MFVPVLLQHHCATLFRVKLFIYIMIREKYLINYSLCNFFYLTLRRSARCSFRSDVVSQPEISTKEDYSCFYKTGDEHEKPIKARSR